MYVWAGDQNQDLTYAKHKLYQKVTYLVLNNAVLIIFCSS